MSKKALDRVADISSSSRIEHLTARCSVYEGQIRKLLRERGKWADLMVDVKTAVLAQEPLSPLIFSRRPPRADSNKPMVPVIIFSDWHIGERIRSEETEGFGDFNYDIACTRVGHIVQKFRDWVATHRNSFRIEECHVFCIGDFVSGDIHNELRYTNEFPLPVQAAKSGQLLGEAIRQIAQDFDSVVVVEEAADNHGRLEKKPQSKQKSTNNITYVTYQLANAHISKLPNVKIVESDGMMIRHTVNGKQFLIEHGDNLRGWMGIPFYSMERKLGREATRRMILRRERELSYDYLCIGHWHVPSFLNRMTVINGSLSGTSEFDHGVGRFARPAQVSFMVHPVYGIFDWTAWEPK